MSGVLNKKVIIIVGWVVGLITPLFLKFVYGIEFSEIGKSLFFYLQLSALISLKIIDLNYKLVIQKILILVAFIVYPILVTAFLTNQFHENTFVVSILTGWLYMLGLVSLYYVEK